MKACVSQLVTVALLAFVSTACGDPESEDERASSESQIISKRSDTKKSDEQCVIRDAYERAERDGNLDKLEEVDDITQDVESVRLLLKNDEKYGAVYFYDEDTDAIAFVNQDGEVLVRKEGTSWSDANGKSLACYKKTAFWWGGGGGGGGYVGCTSLPQTSLRPLQSCNPAVQCCG